MNAGSGATAPDWGARRAKPACAPSPVPEPDAPAGTKRWSSISGYVAVGSYNLDRRSGDINTELALLVDSLSTRKNRHADLLRQLLASIFAVLLPAGIALGFDPQTKAEIDELISFVQTSDVRFIRNGQEYSGAEGAQHLRDKLAKAGDRVKTTDDFITGIASASYLSGKTYMVKFPDGRTQPTGEWLKAHLYETRKNKR